MTQRHKICCMSTKIWRLPSYPKRFLWYDAVGTLSLKYACRVSCVSPKLASFQYLEYKWKGVMEKNFVCAISEMFESF